MEFRVLSGQMPGRPVWAAIVMLGLLALAGLAVVAVTSYKGNRAIVLGRPVALPDVHLVISPPAGWQGGVQPDAEDMPEVLAHFFEPGAQLRHLYYQQVIDDAASPAMVLARAAGGGFEVAGQPTPVALAGLPARQAILQYNFANQSRKVIVRMAVLAPGRYLVIQLVCLGPPTEYELRLMNALAGAVRLDRKSYVPAEDLARADGVELAGDAGQWLARLVGRDRHGAVLLPSGGEDSPAPFWGAVGISRFEVAPDADFEELLRTLSRPGGAPRPSLLPALRRILGGDDVDEEDRSGDGWGDERLRNLLRVESTDRRLVLRRPAAAAAAVPRIERLTAGPLVYWRLRQPIDDVLRFRYLFRPLTRAVSAAPDSGTMSRPGDDQPVAGRAHDAVLVDAWTIQDDEPAATAAIEKLILSIRQP